MLPLVSDDSGEMSVISEWSLNGIPYSLVIETR
jgi:hypothetical protein